MKKTWLLAIMVVSNFGFAQEQNSSNNNKTILQRVKNRDFPSVFQAWNPCDSIKNEDADKAIARHDLIFCLPDHLGLKWNNDHPGLADSLDADSVQAALQRRSKLLQMNPNLIFLAEIRYYDAPNSYLPSNHEWFKRDPNGVPLVGWTEQIRIFVSTSPSKPKPFWTPAFMMASCWIGGGMTPTGWN